MHETPLTGLVLGGGGARAAYQVGVLQGLSRLRAEALGAVAGRSNPFGVICGTSAGAIIAAGLACRADHFDDAVAQIAEVWREFSADQVYRADSIGVLRTGARWLTMLSVGWIIARWRRMPPRSLLDNAPLADLLKRLVPLERLPALFSQRHLHALAVTASSYSSGEHYTFYDSAAPIAPWQRSQRIAAPTPLRHEHLLASSAIPFVFPATPLSWEGRAGWFGDGSMRQTAPLSARHPFGRAAAGDHRRRAHARTGWPHAAEQQLPEPGADCRPRDVEHLPGRAGGGHRTHAAHQPHAGTAAGRSARSDAA